MVESSYSILNSEQCCINVWNVGRVFHFIREELRSSRGDEWEESSIPPGGTKFRHEVAPIYFDIHDIQSEK